MRRDLNRRRKVEDDNGGVKPAWMQTYSDMVTLLLAFFVLLYSFSSIDVQRFYEVMAAIQHQFMGRTGILEGTVEPGAEAGESLDISDFMQDTVTTTLGEREQTIMEMMEQVEETYEQVQNFLREAGLEEDVEIRLEERGIVMEFPERILFDTGEAEIKEEFGPTLELLGEMLADLPNEVIIEGHTDNVPINTLLYPSNWELSVARAVSVTRQLVEEEGLAPERFAPTGYGEYRPIDTNETAEGRARNRRVSVVISMREFEKERGRESLEGLEGDLELEQEPEED